MPCHEPPPPEDAPEFRANQHQAVRLLCELVGAQIENGQPMPSRFVRWFIEHRELDAWIAENQARPDLRKARYCRAYAEEARRFLREMKS